MKNKRIIAITAALMFGIQAGFATDISGVSGVNGVYNINPETSKGGAGFRHYENFYLSEQDIANLIMKDGTKNLDTFINLVDNKVNIQGILNTMRDGGFSSGNAVFITPKGMVVGQNGVINVGSLSVLTPSDGTYKNVLKDPVNLNLKNLQEETNGEILIRGKVLARGNVNLQGSKVVLPETSVIVNGVSDNVLVTSQNQVNDIIFNSIVNTQNLDVADKTLVRENGKIVLKSNAEDGMINVRGQVYNLNSGSTKLVNFKGSNGIKVTGQIHNVDGDLVLSNGAGQTLIKGDLINSNGTLSITDNGTGIHINSGASVVANSGKLNIENNGTNGLAIYGDVLGLDKDVAIINNNGKLYIAGNVNGKSNVQIINNAVKDSTLMVAKTGTVSSGNELSMENYGDGGLFVNGEITSENGISMENRAGDLTINNKVSNSNGDLTLINSGKKLSIATKGSVENKGNNLVLLNGGSDGMVIYGNVENDGNITSIRSSRGKMVVNGTINAKSGNLGVINTGDAMELTKNSVITNANGKTNIINNGEGGMKAYGTINANDELNIINDNGQLYIDGHVAGNNSDINILSRNDSDGVYIKTTAYITNLPRIEADKVGNITIKDTSKAGGSGVIIKGTVDGYNDVNVISSHNNVYTSGSVNAMNNLSYTNTAENGHVTFTKDAEVNEDINYELKNGSQVYYLPQY